ncbi:SRPBCC family protein [Pedococcus sp. 5OH_020]|uniref:SRPBCC family protein n=1 Tax=Pedococcus sp. 5OH_020 TaxID=2989814 RepID=UPI0022E9C3A7|nr:SRPBCC family protein [Pedococcus sp. 5OH_020]
MEHSTVVDIAASPQRVWQVLTDVERWPDWTRSVRWVRRLEEGPLRTGSRAKISQPRLPTVDWTVIDLEPEEGFTWVSTGPGSKATARHWIQPLPGGGSTVRLSVEQSGPLGVLVGRLYSGLTDRYLAMEAAGLKRQCEASVT